MSASATQGGHNKNFISVSTTRACTLRLRNASSVKVSSRSSKWWTPTELANSGTSRRRQDQNSDMMSLCSSPSVPHVIIHCNVKRQFIWHIVARSSEVSCDQYDLDLGSSFIHDIHRAREKCATLLLPLTLPNAKQFFKFFHRPAY